MAKWVDEGENEVANILFVATTPWTNTYLRLYTNDNAGVDHPETIALAGLTQPSGFGYGPKTLARGTWTVAGGADNANYAQQTFTATGGAWGNVYGYYIATTSDNTGKCLCVERFTNGPYNVQDGGSIKVTPKITVA